MSTYRPSIASRWLLLLAVAILAPCGCATWRQSAPMKLVSKLDVPDGVPWKSDKVRRGVPRRLVATWTDTVKQQPGAEAERGFGGRIFFYDSDETKPIGVEGQLVVYAFDETDRLPTNNQPNKRYVFPSEQFKLHESNSDLGVSYSFWLPWDRVGGPQADVSLMARFEPVEGGALIVSEMTRERLPGSLNDKDVMIAQAQAPTQSAVQHASYSSEAAPPPEPRKNPGLQTTTIRRPAAPAVYGAGNN